MTETRINKYISASGILSRRKADEFILQGRITVNNITVTEPGFKIDTEKDNVSIDGEAIKPPGKKVYILLNKPINTISSVSDDKKRTTVVDLINIPERIFPVGRLDYDTSGLMVLTNDGEFANQLMHPRYKIFKTYLVDISRPLEERHKIKFSEGVVIDGRKTEPCKIKFSHPKNKQSISISIREGRNRQIRKMLEKFGYFIRGLHRIEYGNLKLDNLKPGKWRYLTAKEIADFKNIK